MRTLSNCHRQSRFHGSAVVAGADALAGGFRRVRRRRAPLVFDYSKDSRAPNAHGALESFLDLLENTS
jgi:hypothetical protein